jgi:uncharacterized membrane protein
MVYVNRRRHDLYVTRVWKVFNHGVSHLNMGKGSHTLWACFQNVIEGHYLRLSLRSFFVHLTI